MKKHRFTWFDGLILGLILLLLAGTAVKFLVLDPSARQQTAVPFSMELKISGLRQYSVDAIQEGDALYEDAGKAMVGVITGIRAEPAEAEASFPDGTIETVPVEDRFDIYLTVSATGVKKDGIYQIGTYRLRQNDSILFYTKYSIWTGQIRDILEETP